MKDDMQTSPRISLIPQILLLCFLICEIREICGRFLEDVFCLNACPHT